MSAARYDAVIVGARVAGASTALLLARSGLRVALLDRAAEGSDTLSTHALMRPGVIQLHRWGVLPRIIEAGTPAIRRTAFHYGDVTTTVTLKPVAGVDALYAPRRTVIDPLLVSAARDAGVDVVHGALVDTVHRNGDGRVTGVSGTSAGGSRFTLASAVTIGADGRNSRVAAEVGAPVRLLAEHASAFVYAHVPGLQVGKGVVDDGYEWYYAPDATAGTIPTNDGVTCVWVGTPSQRFRSEVKPDVRKAFATLLHRASPELAARVVTQARGARLRSFAGQRGFVRQAWGPGWALVGDAASFVDPITAHGMSEAMRDAELLARAVHAVVDTGLPEAIALEEYQQTRERLSGGLFAVSDQLASYEWDTTSVEVHLRTLAAAMTEEVDHLLALPLWESGRATHPSERAEPGVA